jgi:hypothetical protein
MRIVYRTHHLLIGLHRQALEATVAQCAAENGGVVGHPSIAVKGKCTFLEVDTGCAWWEEWLRVHGPELERRGLAMIEADIEARKHGSTG